MKETLVVLLTVGSVGVTNAYARDKGERGESVFANVP